jgi:peptidoglycan-associated lipoprotein
MKKMIWLALFLTGCGCRHCIVRTPEAPIPVVSREPEPTPPPRVTPIVDHTPPVTRIEPEAKVESLPSKSEGVRIAEVNGALEDAYFAYDHSDLSAEALTALRRDAKLLCAILAEFPGLKVTLEGHCDERGSAEYNVALGDRRARRAEDVLREYGVPEGAVEIVSYGKEAPQCGEANESCWRKNRRAHMSVRR